MSIMLLSYCISVPFISSLVTFLLLKWWLVTAPKIGLTGKDMNKFIETHAIESGGLSVVLGVAFGVMLSIALNVYFFGDIRDINLLNIVSVILMAGLLGFIDDITGWKKGISPYKRVLLTLPIALPLVIIKSGHSTMDIPFLGPIDLGLVYPLLIVPIGVMGAANAFNMLAGYNGLEAVQALTISVATLFFFIKKGLFDLIPFLISAISAILVFLKYNWYPAKIFPGNTFTYFFGAFYASLVIVGNFEKFGIFLFSLYFLELLFYIRGLLDGIYKENFGIPQPDGSLAPPYNKSYSVTHLSIKLLLRLGIKPTEVRVVILICTIQVIIGTLAVFIF